MLWYKFFGSNKLQEVVPECRFKIKYKPLIGRAPIQIVMKASATATDEYIQQLR